MKSGKLIVFEGIDGVGKSTLAHELLADFYAKGIQCEYSSFPGNQPGTLGKLVYEVHHDSKRFGVDSIASTSLQLLHVAAHIDSIENHIVPTLKTGAHVILDRYWWSTIAYGIVCGANRESLDLMIQLEKNHWGEVMPDVVFLVERDVSFDDMRQTSLRDEYERIVRREMQEYKIVRINNDLEIQHTLPELLNLLNETASRSTKE